MFISTHIGIAMTILRIVEREFSVKLDTAGFIYGNIKPDISPGLMKVLHYKEDSYEFVKQEIKELMEYSLDHRTTCTRQFSEKLGVVTHYLADYFCYAHSSRFRGGKLSHFRYELNLSVYCKCNPRKMKAFKYPDLASVFTDYHEMYSHIEKNHNRYTNQRPCYDLDMAYTHRICTSLCLSVIASCTRNTRNTRKQLILAT